MPKAMNRSAALFVIALVCPLWAGAACAQDSPSDLVTRLDRLEQTVRDLTGSVQELQYRNQQLEQEVQRLQGGAAPMTGAAPAAPPPGAVPVVPERPMVSTSMPPPTATPYSPPSTQYSAPATQYAQPGYGPPPAPVVASAASDGQLAGHDAFNPALNPNAPGVPHPLGSSTTATEPPPPDAAMDAAAQPGAPLNLSNLSAPQTGAAPGGPLPPPPLPGSALPPPPLSNPNATGAMQGGMQGGMQEASLPPDVTPKDEYDAAYGYVLQRNYGLAAQTFRDFLHKFPGDRLTPEAQYWLGESLFQAKNYHDAAEAFLAVSTKYETSAKAPDALLGLASRLRLWAKRKRPALRSAKCCANIPTLRSA